MGCAAGAHSEAPRACRPTHAPFSGTSAAGPRFATEAPCSKAPCGRYRKLVVAQAGFKGFGQRPSKAAKQGAKQGAACPCGSGKSYADCCQRYHKGELPQTAEALMRSRFVAYVNSDAGYVVETTHPDNPQFGGTFKPDGTLSSTLRQDAQVRALYPSPLLPEPMRLAAVGGSSSRQPAAGCGRGRGAGCPRYERKQ